MGQRHLPHPFLLLLLGVALLAYTVNEAGSPQMVTSKPVSPGCPLSESGMTECHFCSHHPGSGLFLTDLITPGRARSSHLWLPAPAPRPAHAECQNSQRTSCGPDSGETLGTLYRINEATWVLAQLYKGWEGICPQRDSRSPS